MPDTVIDLIRHGEPVGGRRYRGCGCDDPLSPAGWDQMWSAVGEARPWQRLITSPLVRCRAFAEALAERLALPMVEEEDLREIGMGSWEGRDHAEVEAAEPEAFAAFYRDPVHRRPPGAESLASLIDRAGRTYDRIVAEHPGEHLLIVAHAGVLRALVGRTLGADPARWYRVQIDYAGVVRVRHGRFGPALEHVNAQRVR
jgi:alpha-ribazole phosphatase